MCNKTKYNTVFIVFSLILQNDYKKLVLNNRNYFLYTQKNQRTVHHYE